MLALFFFDVRNQDGNRLFHHAGAFDYLRQEHLARTKQVAHDIHTIHQRAFNDLNRSAASAHNFCAQLFGVFFDKGGDAMH